MLRPGDRAPDFALADLDGRHRALKESLQDGHAAVLVFLRHLG